MCAGVRAEQHRKVAMSARWAWHPQSAGLSHFLCQLNTNDGKALGMAEQQFGRSSLDFKEIQPVHSKGDQSWVFFGRTDAKAETLATSCEELTHWKRLWCWEGLGAGGEGDDRRWDGWMASPTRWTWVWVNSWSWWWTGRPGMLQFMRSQRVRHDWVTELNWIYKSQWIIRIWNKSNTFKMKFKLKKIFKIKLKKIFKIPKFFSKWNI